MEYQPTRVQLLEQELNIARNEEAARKHEEMISERDRLVRERADQALAYELESNNRLSAFVGRTVEKIVFDPAQGMDEITIHFFGGGSMYFAGGGGDETTHLAWDCEGPA